MKKTWIYVAAGLLSVYLLGLAYKKYKVGEEASNEDQKDVLITQVLILNKEEDTPENRAKYISLSVDELQKMLTPKIPQDSGPEPTDTTGLQ